MCHGRPRSSSATSPDSTEDTTPRPSISSLRSRFEGLAAGTSEPKAGGGDARRTSSAGGRKPNGNVDVVRGAPVSRISKSRQPNSPPSPPSDPSAIASDPLPGPHPPGSRPGEARRPVIVSTPASPARMSESSSLPNPMIIPASLRDSSSSSAAPSNSPVLGASPVLFSPKPARRTAPAVPPKMRSPFSTPNGSDDGADTSYRDQVASVTALGKRFSASPSPEAESSTAHRSSITLSQGPSVVDSVDRLAPTAMARQLSVPSFERKSFGGAAPPADDSSLLPSSDAKSPGIIGERTTARNPPPPPPPLSRSASPGPSQTKSDRNKSSTGGSPTAGSFPSNAKFPAELAPQDETNPGPPSLPVRKSASSTPDPGFSTSLPTLPGPRPKVSPSTPILRGPSAESAIRAPPLPDRARAHSIGKIGDPRSPHIPPKLPSRTAAVAIPASDPAHAPASSMPSSIPISPDRTRDLENGYQPLRPPVRSTTIGVVASPPRRADTRNTGMSSDDEDEEDTLAAGHTTAAKRLHEDYPDSTHANRRHPRFIPDVRISSVHHVNSFAVFGRYVCTGAHHVRVYDTQMSDRPLFTVDLKDVGLEFRIKEPRVTAMCFRPVSLPADEGRYLWCGTKDGHLWELDIRTGTVTDRRSFVHGATVVSILRHQKWLITVDENGKVHIFEMPPTAKGGIAEDASSVPQTYRTIRITEKFTFVKMIRGKLWTSSAPASRSTTNTSSRGATIRVYDLFTQEPVPPSQSMFTSEWTGAVTSGTILPLKPDVVYIGHEGGFVSVWSADYINCLQVLKTSTTDILSLEGVGERLWVGNRKGQIHVYDVNEKPWRTTNIWTAHPDLPIHSLIVDPWSIEHAGRLTLWSAARDTIRAWDGLLSVDWIDNQMKERQPDYCRFRNINILVCSWNINSAKPSDLSGSEPNALFFEQLFGSVNSPDIIIFGFQEVIPLGDKKLTAKTLLFGGKNKESGTTADKVSLAYRQWLDKMQYEVKMAMPADTPYVKIHSESLVGLLTCVLVKASQKDALRDLDICTVKRGIGGIYGNKGAIIARMVVDDTSICVINVHLASGQSQKASRNMDLGAIMEDKAILPASDELPFVHGGDGTAILDHEMVILQGDMNYRIDKPRENVLSSITAGDLPYLLEHDQLRKEIRNNHAFRLRTFEEAPITFNPTYKYNAGSEEYDSSEKRRIPAWCDRILFNNSPRIQSLNYKRYEATISDHRPVSAGFQATIKAVDGGKMNAVRGEVMAAWAKKEAEMLSGMAEAYGRLI